MIYEQADEVSRLLELRTAATSANDYVSDLVCFLIEEYQRLIPNLQHQFTLITQVPRVRERKIVEFFWPLARWVPDKPPVNRHA